MSLFNRKKSESPDKPIREHFDPTFFDGTRLKRDVDLPVGHLANLLVHSEIRRLDTNDRLDQLIELQRETLETQKAILNELRKR
ncbi:hypothetical protein RMS29_028590 (plasmid) [Agrobacterium rosae]|uniref:Transcriptional regulator n=1 Tax=Agrobacterium rosae TaxID=1972867 RepID=A0ABU4W8C0_9HYPH|nr:hypothetical protein [Agrobacterium rosae]MDX8333000.1 hypothetical protein [Agrobacterium rosae]NSY46871.1 hypothetical protein [Agrobacterium tumefaciens]